MSRRYTLPPLKPVADDGLVCIAIPGTRLTMEMLPTEAIELGRLLFSAAGQAERQWPDDEINLGDVPWPADEPLTADAPALPPPHHKGV